MAIDSSPLPLRHSNAAPQHTPVRHAPITIDDDLDELGGDTIPCSPAAFLPRRDELRSANDSSQPFSFVSTQKPSRPRSSSPASIIEVPASSPFRTAKPNFGSRLAPAGTVFRPPPARPQQQKPEKKRPAPEPVTLISDDEDDLTPPRGDIRPTTFKSQIAAFSYNPDDDRKVTQKLKQLYEIFGNKYPSDVVRSALRRCNDDINDTADWLEQNHKTQPSKPTTGRRLVTKASLESSNRAPKRPSPAISVASSSPPRPPKRRLIQGLRNPSSQSSLNSVPAPPSSDDPLIIDLVDNDNEDAYEAEKSPELIEDDDERVLKCINNSTLKELAAMTGMKELLLEPLVNKRPFVDLAQARRVSINKPSSRRPGKINVGENAVDAVSVFQDAVGAIDEVVAVCETKAQTVKASMDEWDMNSFGHSKRTPHMSPENDSGMPLTPTSLGGSKYVPPPIPRQPQLMDGHCEMKPFQVFGLNWMTLLYNNDIGCILADEMGLGKTCQVISLMAHLVETYEDRPQGPRPWPNLIVVPPSTYMNWLDEFERFAPGVSVMGYRGSQAERAEIAYEVEHNREDYHVVLATYSQINSEDDVEAMQSFKLNSAIFDEGHKMKNPETKVYKDLRRITASWKMLLTGTPVQNNLLEMTSLLNFINPKLFHGYMDQIQYIFSHKVTVRDVSNGAFLYGERVRRARTILEPFILQRRKDQVLSDMPLKRGTVVHCDMTDAQKPVYDEYEHLFRSEPSVRRAHTSGRQNDVNNVWMQLRKAALHPLLFRRHFTDAMVEKMGTVLMKYVPQSELHQPELKHLVQELKNSSDFELHLWCRDYPKLLGDFDISSSAKLDSGKVKKLLELVAQYQKNGDRVLVFSKFSRLIELLREVLRLKDIDHRVLMGNTNVAERQDLIDEFNGDASIPVFLLTTGAGGTGINLTAANKVIIFDQSDNPQDDIQAENRAHRLGQTRDVEIVRLIARGTVEELIYKACQKKIELANKVTGAVGEDEAGVDDGFGIAGEEIARNLEKEVRMMMEGEKMTPP